MVHVFAFAGFATTAPKEMADQEPPVFRTKMLRWSLGGDPQAMPASRLKGIWVENSVVQACCTSAEKGGLLHSVGLALGHYH